MRFFKKIQQITEKALEEKPQKLIEVSEAMILEANKRIEKKAKRGERHYVLYYTRHFDDCDLTYIEKYYRNEGFFVRPIHERSCLVISW